MADEQLFGVAVEETPLFGEPVKEAPEEEYEGVAQEFFEGIGSGATKVVQGVAEVGALASDYLAGTDYHEDVVEGFESFRESLGLDPQGIMGAIGEVGTQFVAPAGLAMKGINALSAVARANKAGKFAANVAAAGLADAAVATNDTVTIGDFFEGGPTETAELVGLEGEERALQGFMNKFKVGIEGAAGMAVAPVIIRGVGEVAGGAATAIGQVPGATQLAQGAKSAAGKVGQKFTELEEAKRMGETLNPFQNATAEVLATLRYRGMLPQEIAESRSLIPGLTQAEVQVADKLVKGLDKDIDKVISEANKSLQGTTPLTKTEVYNTIDKYLTMSNRAEAEDLWRALPTDIQPKLKQMRTHIDQLSEKILNSDMVQKNANAIVKKKSKQTLEDTIRANLGSYIRRRYRVFEDANYKPTDEAMDIAVAGFKNDVVATQKELRKIAKSGLDNRTASDLGLNAERKIVGQVTQEQAMAAAENFLKRYQMAGEPMKGVSRVALDKVDTGMFLSRKNLKDYQKALLGEVKNPLENYVATVSDLSQFKAVDNFFGQIRQLADANPNGLGKMFRNTEGMSNAQKKELTESGYTILGSGKGSSKADKTVEEAFDTSGWGSLYGYAVPNRVYQDLTRTVIGDAGWLPNTIRSTYSGFLRVKGFTQYGKTILSPVTQIRNVTTASAFAAAQGNIGKGANLWESMDLVFENLRRMPKDQQLKEFQELQKLGVVNSQAELRELQELIAKGFGYTDEKVIGGVAVKPRLGSRYDDNSVMRFIKGTGKRAENLYQAGDDIWKVYNYTFETNKLRNAMSKMTPEQEADFILRRSGKPLDKDAFLREEAARIVRNTVPNYNLAPEAIKALRRAPVGNFIAFPYEILRTGMNTIARGVDELADPNVEIQKIGLRRLTGALSTYFVLPAAMSQMAYKASGVSKDEMDAYRRSLAAPWEKNARLLPTGRHEDGTPKYINYSYSNPYDMLTKPIIAALNAYESGQLEGRNGAKIVTDAGFAALGELMSPFTTEAIALAAVRDVLNPDAENPIMSSLGQFGRGGRTITGAKVYNKEDSPGDQIAKSFAHITDALLPSIVPFDADSSKASGIRGDYSRFARGFINSMDLNDTLGVSEKDKMGRERDLAGELARAFSGITESDSQASKSLKYKGYEFAKARQDAANIFNSIARRPNVSREELLEAYKDANEARYRAFNRFHQTLQDVQTFGMKPEDIQLVLDEANIGGVDEILAGLYEPFEISKTVLDDMVRNDTIDALPLSEITDIQSEQFDRPFGQVNFESPQPVVEETPLFGVPVDDTPEETPLFGVPVDQESSLRLPKTTPRRGPVSPALLGDNPIDAARNAEIANRG